MYKHVNLHFISPLCNFALICALRNHFCERIELMPHCIDYQISKNTIFTLTEGEEDVILAHKIKLKNPVTTRTKLQENAQ